MSDQARAQGEGLGAVSGAAAPPREIHIVHHHHHHYHYHHHVHGATPPSDDTNRSQQTNPPTLPPVPSPAPPGGPPESAINLQTLELEAEAICEKAAITTTTTTAQPSQPSQPPPQAAIMTPAADLHGSSDGSQSQEGEGEVKGPLKKMSNSNETTDTDGTDSKEGGVGSWNASGSEGGGKGLVVRVQAVPNESGDSDGLDGSSIGESTPREDGMVASDLRHMPRPDAQQQQHQREQQQQPPSLSPQPPPAHAPSPSAPHTPPRQYDVAHRASAPLYSSSDPSSPEGHSVEFELRMEENEDGPSSIDFSVGRSFSHADEDWHPSGNRPFYTGFMPQSFHQAISHTDHSGGVGGMHRHKFFVSPLLDSIGCSPVGSPTPSSPMLASSATPSEPDQSNNLPELAGVDTFDHVDELPGLKAIQSRSLGGWSFPPPPPGFDGNGQPQPPQAHPDRHMNGFANIADPSSAQSASPHLLQPPLPHTGAPFPGPLNRNRSSGDVPFALTDTTQAGSSISNGTFFASQDSMMVAHQSTMQQRLGGAGGGVGVQGGSEEMTIRKSMSVGIDMQSLRGAIGALGDGNESGLPSTPTPSQPSSPHPTGRGRRQRRGRAQCPAGDAKAIKEAFEINLEKIKSGEEQRTTLMIRNIPNKYTQRMLLQTINRSYRGQYDFFYLPIDFKNKCNVGYAFINFIEPTYIPPFHIQFHGSRWEKFNSEKICSVTYARIQGKEMLMSHFLMSSVMYQDRRMRPIFKLDQTDQQNAFFKIHNVGEPKDAPMQSPNTHTAVPSARFGSPMDDSDLARPSDSRPSPAASASPPPFPSPSASPHSQHAQASSHSVFRPPLPGSPPAEMDVAPPPGFASSQGPASMPMGGAALHSHPHSPSSPPPPPPPEQQQQQQASAAGPMRGGSRLMTRAQNRFDPLQQQQQQQQQQGNSFVSRDVGR
mmetsp:Transcript_42438/g.105891  ORF Transcript_42438/g.105891 Transcript_42438/m.105891 type:complete len:937 (-) Transcript_42438:46-2856(-)